MKNLIANRKVSDYFLHVTDVLSPDEQLQLFDEITTLAIPSQGPLWENLVGPTGMKKESRYTALFNIQMDTSTIDMKGRQGESVVVPPLILKALTRVLSRANVNLPLCPSTHRYAPGTCEVIIYDSDGFVEAHCDCLNGWVVVLSLGCSASFWYLDDGASGLQDSDSKKYITVVSGDAVIFNGSAALNIQHGVNAIIPNSFPINFTDKFSTDKPQYLNKRIILQVHQNVGGPNVLDAN